VTAKSALPRLYSSGSLDPETEGALARPLFTGTMLEDRFLIGEELSVRRFGPTYAATEPARGTSCLVTVLEALDRAAAQGVIARLIVFGLFGAVPGPRRGLSGDRSSTPTADSSTVGRIGPSSACSTEAAHRARGLDRTSAG
jgi:hypothetical protein